MNDNDTPGNMPEDNTPPPQPQPQANIPPGAGPADTPGAADGLPSKDDRTWAMLAHLSSIIAMLLGGFSFLGPLVIWLVKKEQSEFVDDQGKESLNFQITIGIVLLILYAVTFVTCGVAGIVTVPLILVLLLVDLILVIMASIAANDGQRYRYGFNWRLIK